MCTTILKHSSFWFSFMLCVTHAYSYVSGIKHSRKKETQRLMIQGSFVLEKLTLIQKRSLLDQTPLIWMKMVCNIKPPCVVCCCLFFTNFFPRLAICLLLTSFITLILGCSFFYYSECIDMFLYYLQRRRCWLRQEPV